MIKLLSLPVLSQERRERDRKEDDRQAEKDELMEWY